MRFLVLSPPLALFLRPPASRHRTNAREPRFRNETLVLARNVMKFDDFREALRTLFTLEMHELVQAGAIAREDYQSWRTFKIDPLRWFLIADDRTAQAVWVAIERRRRGVATGRAVGGNHPIVARFVPRNAHRG